MTAEAYKRILNWLRAVPLRCKAAQLITEKLPMLFMIGYSAMAVILLLYRDGRVVRFLAVPTATLGCCILLRRLIDRSRPYEVHDFQPLIARDKKGRSCPSNHTVSAVVIALAFWYISPVGAWVLVPAALVALSRIAAGVHWPTDVLAAVGLVVLIGTIGFWII